MRIVYRTNDRSPVGTAGQILTSQIANGVSSIT